jgi:hypothetical protein
MEHAERFLLRFGFDGFQGTINNAFSNRLFPIKHDGVHKFREHHIPKLGIGQNFPLLGTTTTSHISLSF